VGKCCFLPEPMCPAMAALSDGGSGWIWRKTGVPWEPTGPIVGLIEALPESQRRKLQGCGLDFMPRLPRALQLLPLPAVSANQPTTSFD